MNKIIAEIRIVNIFVPFIYISKSLKMHDYGKQKEYREREGEHLNLLLKQGFIWYQDFIEFNMLSDYQRYWVKIAISNNLEIDYFIANAKELRRSDSFTVIILPFQITSEERIYVFGDNYRDVNLSFTLPVGHYQLLFQNRLFTTEEIEAEPNCDRENIELCLLTFIPTQEAIEQKILAYNDRFGSKNYPTPLIFSARKMYDNNGEYLN